jgi:hypothetical protein
LETFGHQVVFFVGRRRRIFRTVGAVVAFDAGRELPERTRVDLLWRETYDGAVGV